MNKIWLSALGICVVGCSHYPAPTEQVASSMAAVRGAEEAGAAQVPQAALHVKLAEEQIKSAQTLMSDEKNRAADDMARRAGSDAELAVAIAHEESAKGKLAQFAQANQAAGGEAMPTQPAAGAMPMQQPAAGAVQ